METVLGGLSYEGCLVYLDDIIIVGHFFEEYLKNIRRVLQRLKEANLKLSPSKCHLFRREVTYLGHIISAEGSAKLQCHQHRHGTHGDESVRKDQLADPEIKPIIEFKVSSDEKPSWQDIAPFHPTTKRYWALWDSLHLRNGVLYRKWESDDGKTFRWQLILPKTRVSTALKELHGSPTGGHFGVMKTLQKVRERFYWNNVRSDVEKCCRICDPCAARKGPRKRTRGRLQLYNMGAPFE
ncbi:retrovirus-related Pol polyprotein from transposon 297 [Trichonephila clavipes]|nr:retrovirus-related Pol polyprotein from transposon 297 [Trichonephila clavipes]